MFSQNAVQLSIWPNGSVLDIFQAFAANGYIPAATFTSSQPPAAVVSDVPFAETQ